MTTIRIDYLFDFDHLDEDMWTAPVRITIDDIVITKMIDEDPNDGFVGDHLMSELVGWLRSIPSLLKGDIYESSFIEWTSKLEFRPKNGMIYIRIWLPTDPSDEYSDNENVRKNFETDTYYNKSFPNYPDGTPVPPAILFNEFIRVGEEFLSNVRPSDYQRDEIVIFREALNEAKEFLKKESGNVPETAGNT